MNLKKKKMKGLISALPFWFLKKEKEKKKKGNNKNRGMSLLNKFKENNVGGTWGMSDTCKTENFFEGFH
jgi:hypothetical protein